MTEFSRRDKEVRSEFLNDIARINLALHEIQAAFDARYQYMALPFPTLDNNIWVSYPQLQHHLIEKLTGESTDYQIPLPRRLKRSWVGISIELLWQLTGRWFRVRTAMDSKRLQRKKAVGIFTYSDYDPVVSGLEVESKYFAKLATWLENTEIFWTGLGERKVKSENRAHHTIFPIIHFYALSGFVSSFPIRIKAWREVKSLLRHEPLFQLLKDDFRRALFGFPALQSEFLRRDIRRLLKINPPELILIPYENQLWERVLSLECHRLGVILAGALHTTPRFWDLRFFNLSPFHNLQPDFIIDNGPSSRNLLKLSGFPKSKVIHGTALRFEHLANSTPETKTAIVGLGKVLVILGTNLAAASQLVACVQSFRALKEEDLYFRPHPSTLRWFSKNYSNKKIDSQDFKALLANFDSFITDSMSSMSIELAHYGANVFVFAPKDELNFSPLASVPNFDKFFHDEASFAALLDTPKVKFELSEVLDVTDSESKWKKIIERLLIHGSQEK